MQPRIVVSPGAPHCGKPNGATGSGAQSRVTLLHFDHYAHTHMHGTRHAAARHERFEIVLKNTLADSPGAKLGVDSNDTIDLAMGLCITKIYTD